MKQQLGCLSPTGLLVALLVILVVVAYTLLNGGGLFSPGPLTAANTGDNTLEGYRSHAQFEDQCTHCHRPWRGVDPERCVACHTNVRDQIGGHDGLHGQLNNPDDCMLCHTEHQGRAANITANALPNFPHQKVGFSLARHRRHADGQPFVCAACHPDSDYAFDQALCETCHITLNATFMTRHVTDFAGDCLACHDGSGAMVDFDHDAVFALAGTHTSLECAACHVNGRYKGLPSDCLACHEEPDVHLGQFGTDCAACHTDHAWIPARLLQHTFPLDHGSRTEIECQVCHPANYVAYTCYGCHEHDPLEVEQEHFKMDVLDLKNCGECHPTGRKEENEHGEQDRD